MIEFDCCECHGLIIAIALDAPSVPPLCAVCICVASWFEDPALVKSCDFEGEAAT